MALLKVAGEVVFSICRSVVTICWRGSIRYLPFSLLILEQKGHGAFCYDSGGSDFVGIISLKCWHIRSLPDQNSRRAESNSRRRFTVYPVGANP